MDWKELVSALQNKRVITSWSFLVVILLMTAVTLFQAMDQFIKEIVPTPPVRGIIYLVILALEFGLWFRYRNALPKRLAADPSKSLGILIAIEANSPEALSLLDEAFIPQFKDEIQQSGLADLIEVIPCQHQHQAKRIGEIIETLEEHQNIPRKHTIINSKREAWTSIHTTVNAEFYLWGKLYRHLGTFVFDFKGYVDENLEPALKDELKREYKSFEIRRRMYNEGEALQGVQIEARFFNIVARDVISLVAFYTGKLEESYRLHKVLEQDLVSMQGLSAKPDLTISLNRRLSAIHFLRARQMMSKATTREAISESEAELELARHHDPTNSNVYMFAGANEYLLRRNWQSAWNNIQLAKQYAPEGADAWKYSVAFLQLANGDYWVGLRTYEEIFSSSFTDEEIVARQVIHFNKALLAQGHPPVPPKFIIPLVTGKVLKQYDDAIRGLNEFMSITGKTGKHGLLWRAAKKFRDEFIHASKIENSVERLLNTSS
jgi:tetratricopeptide (TPR) repeat protein